MDASEPEHALVKQQHAKARDKVNCLLGGNPIYNSEEARQSLAACWRSILPMGVANIIGEFMDAPPLRERLWDTAQELALATQHMNSLRTMAENFDFFSPHVHRQRTLEPTRSAQGKNSAGFEDGEAGIASISANAGGSHA